MEKSGSRLLQMQARYQQKQMQEREMKIASLYEAQQARALDRVRHSPSSGTNVANGVTSPPPVPNPPGKVRQMFEERRTRAGIDKSYPLQPIHNTERAGRKPLPNGFPKVSSSTTKVQEKRTTKLQTTTTTVHTKKQRHISNHSIINNNTVTGSGDINHNHQKELNGVKPKCEPNGELIGHGVDELDNNYLLENETFPEEIAPLPTPRSPEVEPKKPPRRSPANRRSPAAVSSADAPRPPPRKTSGDKQVSSENKKASGVMQRTAAPAARKEVLSASSGKNLRSPRATATASAASTAAGQVSGHACEVCGRRFAEDRLQRHQDICRKSHNKKRKPYDVLKHRLAGTEAEALIPKLRKTTTNTAAAKAKPLNSTWRQKHKEFIEAIRAAKQVQAHLDAGGKLSDLPPPPPSENPDYVQCPHCQRRFNQCAAERHIPKCASFQFNKPKPPPKKR